MQLPEKMLLLSVPFSNWVHPACQACREGVVRQEERRNKATHLSPLTWKPHIVIHRQHTVAFGRL